MTKLATELERGSTCIFCGPSYTEVMIPRDVLPDRVAVLRCRGCGLVFLESRVEEDELDPEETVYWDSEEQKNLYLEERVQRVFVEEFEKRLAMLEKCLGGTGRLLDVGCGVGHFLERARKRGWSVQGLDISKAALAAASEAYGLEVRVGTLESAIFTSAEFDAISLWDVIEHIRRPLENLKSANRLLRKGGLLVMKTPNESGFFKQLALACYRVFGRRAAFLLKYVYYTPHYFSYSKETLDRLLRESGFEAASYEWDDTPLEFAEEKINLHYRKDARRGLVIALLPLGRFFARLFRMNNKLVVYARKVREMDSDE